jgi:hypothetical protein
MKTAEELLRQMGIDPEEAIEVDRSLTTKKRRDRRICICGHGASRHIHDNGVSACVPSRLTCTCQMLRPVLEVDDTRKFLRKSSGPGTRHALIRGMTALIEDGKFANWIDELSCDKCEAKTLGIVPVPLSFGGRVAYSEDDMSGKHVFLCQDCLEEIL